MEDNSKKAVSILIIIIFTAMFTFTGWFFFDDWYWIPCFALVGLSFGYAIHLELNKEDKS